MGRDRRVRLTSGQQAISCVICGATLWLYPSEHRASAQHFCSRACLGTWRSQQTGPKAAHWQGGSRRDGVRAMVHMPWHPAAQNGYVHRHRIVAELKLGRSLRPGEIVHHIDGDPTNDHPDNLQVMTQSDHIAIHRQQLVDARKQARDERAR